MGGVAEDNVVLSRSAALAIRHLLWDMATTDSTQYAQRVQCDRWGAELDHLAAKPAWPTTAERTADTIAFYERALGKLRKTDR